jgi:hypothetical protein
MLPRRERRMLLSFAPFLSESPFLGGLPKFTTDHQMREEDDNKRNNEDGDSIPGDVESLSPWLIREGCPTLHDIRLRRDDDVTEDDCLRRAKKKREDPCNHNTFLCSVERQVIVGQRMANS